jgi:hypothetical protein
LEEGAGMNLTSPTYNSKDQAYVFLFSQVGEEFQVETDSCFLEPGSSNYPVPSLDQVRGKEDELIRFFIDHSKPFFASPIREPTLKKRIQHVFMEAPLSPESMSTWVRATWAPREMKVRKTEFLLGWAPVHLTQGEPHIAPDFLDSVTPRVQSPVHTPGDSIKQIHISNPIEYPQMGEGLVAIGDLPLSDGVVDFGLSTESPEKAEERKRIREARLRASLAKLKAERLASRYYQRYGSPASNDSSELSESETSSESS